jgi:hypothetical protein
MAGQWQPITTQIWETVVTPCDCCGQVVAKRIWVVELEGEDMRFCSPVCEELYRSYVLPKARAGSS